AVHYWPAGACRVLAESRTSCCVRPRSILADPCLRELPTLSVTKHSALQAGLAAMPRQLPATPVPTGLPGVPDIMKTWSQRAHLHPVTLALAPNGHQDMHVWFNGFEPG
ncbi:MAG: hypothetical protein OXB95_03245, partial [Rhodobacteraceae bacterium]|nr:hypothetical protein [Paracoccaceae bacterium]